MTGSARAQRVLVFGAIALVGLSVVSIVTVLLAPLFGMTDYTGGIWPLVVVFPLLALPAAFVMFAVALGMVWLRRKS